MFALNRFLIARIIELLNLRSILSLPKTVLGKLYSPTPMTNREDFLIYIYL